tara:strand:+ start:164 stop:769 length:606 start_codon:yes stop_codon:yes gene_type:complete
MDWFETLSLKHTEFLRMVKLFPENETNNNAEDIVQDAYIELTELGTKKHKEGDKRVNQKYKDLPTCKRVLTETGEINMVYMWITLKRVSMNALKKRIKKSEYIIRLGEGFEKSGEEEAENEQAFSLLMNKVEDEMNEWHWYDKLLFETYVKDSRSMRGLSSDTHISLTSIFTTLRNCKNRIRENVGEDFLDYMNEDYELIK